MSNYSPISSAARAGAKGICQNIRNDLRASLDRIHTPAMTNRRTVNYKIVINGIRSVCGDNICMEGEFGKKKQRTYYIISLGTTVEGDDLGVMMFVIPFKDPANYRDVDLDINITRHVRERLFQRHSDDYKHVASEIGRFVQQMAEMTVMEDGTYEVGTGSGLFIMTIASGEQRHIDLITYVDDHKLRPEQSAKAGEYRRIER